MAERQKIIETTSSLFKEIGIRANTMDNIARKTGISKKTLYQYFNDKNELINLVIDSEYIYIKKSIKHINTISNDEIEKLIRVNILIINFLKDINPICINDMQKIYKDIYDNSKIRFKKLFSAFIIECIKEGKEEGLFINDINEVLITSLHTDNIDKVQESTGFWNNSFTEIKEMITYYIRGLVTSKGSITLKKHINNFDKYTPINN
jgi:AcrR family transcriptional regulator